MQPNGQYSPPVVDERHIQVIERLAIVETRVVRIAEDVEELQNLAKSVMKAALLGAVCGGSAVVAIVQVLGKLL